jgi:hypothetical protein
LWLAVAVLIAGALAWVGVERLLSDQEPSSLSFAASSAASDAGSPAGSAGGQGSNADALAARTDLEKFTPRFDVMAMQFSTSFNALQKGALSQEDFVDGVEKWLLPQWEALGAELAPTTSDPNSAHASANTEIRGVIDNWHRALMSYSHGLRIHDSSEVFNAFNYLRAAEAHQVRARELYDKLEAQR